MTFVSENAKKDYSKNSKGFIAINKGPFSNFSPAYIITNEDIRWISKITAKNCKNVLTVSASGDQPLFYAMRGAKNIDTFDISYCSKAIMDIKTAAIKNLNYKEYVNLLCDLYANEQILSVQNMDKILPSISEDSQKFITEMNGYKIFKNGYSPNVYKEFLITEAEYKKTQEHIAGNFNFIWTDLINLSAFLTKKYDVINLSNIVEYIKDINTVYNIFEDLGSHLNKYGKMIAQVGCFGIKLREDSYNAAKERFKDWAITKTIPKDKNRANSETIFLIQKIR